MCAAIAITNKADSDTPHSTMDVVKMRRRPDLYPRRRQGNRRLISMVMLFTLFLGVNVEILKWRMASFVLNDDKFNLLLVSKWLSKHSQASPLNFQYPGQNHRRQQALQDEIQNSDMDLFPLNAYHFGFFDPLDAEPTQEEYEGMLCQTKAFYLDLFPFKVGNSIYVDLYSANWTFAPLEATPISHTLVVHATFEDGTRVPLELINGAVEASDMAEYIERFVWAAEPRGADSGVFFETQSVTAEVGFHDQVNYPLERNRKVGSIVLGSTLACPANGYYEATLEFGFFPGFARKPTVQEIEDLIPLSEAFFTRTLQTTYATRKVNVALELKSWHYDEIGNDEMPLNMTFRLLGSFTHRGGDVIPLEYVKQKLAHNKTLKDTIMKDYITQAAWGVPPFKNSTFWDVNRARMNSKIFRYSFHPSLAGSNGNVSSMEAANRTAAGLVNEQNGDPRDRSGDLNFSNAESGSEAQRGVGLDPHSGGTSEGAESAASTPHDPSRTTVSTTVLKPLTISNDQCREHLQAANANLDRFLSEAEFLTFVSSMTNDAYDGYPYVALPDAVQMPFDDLSLKNAAGEAVIHRLGAFPAATSQSDMNLLATSRANQICRHFKSSLNEAIAQGRVESTKLNSTISFFLIHQQDDEATSDATRVGVLEEAFQNFIADAVAPAVIETMVPNKKQRALSMRDHHALPALRRNLLDSASAYVLPSSGKVTRLDTTKCRGADMDDPETECYVAEASVEVFLNNDALSMAGQVGATVEATMKDAVVNGNFELEIRELDPTWRVATM